MTLVLRRACALMALSCAFVSPLAQAQSQDDVDSVPLQALSPAEKEAARQKILELPPAGARYSQLEDFFNTRKVLSERQGDLTVSEQFLRNWLQSLPNDWQAHWEMASLQARLGNLANYFPYAHSAARLASTPAQRARVLAETALKHLQLQASIKQANETMAQAELALSQFQSQMRPDKMGQQYQLARAQARVYTVKAEVQSFTSQYEAATQSALHAVAAARRSLELGQKLDERRTFFARNELVNTLSRQARAHYARGALFDADQSLAQGLKVIAEGGVSTNVRAQLFHTIGNLRVQEGRYREAERWADKSILAMQEAGAGATSLQLLSAQVVAQTALAGQGRWEDAWQKIEALDQTTQNSPQGQKLTRNALTRALVLLKLGRWPQAQTVLEKAWAHQQESLGADHFDTALSEGLLAWALWESGKPADARPHFDSALAKLMAPQGTTSSYEEQGLRKLARQCIAEAYLRALGQGNTTDAQSLGRGFAMADWLSGSSVQQALSDAAQRSRIADPALQDMLRQEQDIGRELEVLYRYINLQASEAAARQTPQVSEQMRQRIVQLSQQKQQLYGQMRKSFPRYEQMVRPRPPTPAQIANWLRSDEVFVQFLSTTDGTYGWAIDRTHGVIGHFVPLNEPAIARLVQRMRATLDVADQGEQARAFDFGAANALYEALLKPLEPMLAGKAHLIVSTSGALAQFPFATLVTSAYAGAPAQAPWLVNQLAISHVPGASAWIALKELSKVKPASQAFMGWGDPLFDTAQLAPSGKTRQLRLTRSTGSGLDDDLVQTTIRYSQIPPLPETRAEIETIATLFKADLKADTLFGQAADRESVLQASASGLLAQKRVLVFATHGLVPGDLPNLTQPALALAANSAADANPLAPLLTLQDVLGLKLNADWVVLSACNTAAAEGRAQEALSGLARGFFYAGSRSLLVTHWAVESESASKLTTATFAHQLTHSEARRAESLRAAMLKVMAQPGYGHPAFWAPYALVGEGGR